MKKFLIFALLFLINFVLLAFADVDNSVGSYLIKDNGSIDRFGNAINVGDLVKNHGLGGQWLVSNANIKYDASSDGTRAINLSARAEGSDRAFVGNWTDYPTAWNYSVSYTVMKKDGASNREFVGIGFYNKTSGNYLGIRYRTDQTDLQWSPNNGVDYNCNAVAVGLGLSTDANTVYNITLNKRNSTYVGCVINGTACPTNCTILGNGFGFDSIYAYSEISTEGLYTDIRVFNGTSLPQLLSSAPDTTAPTIVNYSSQGASCTNWNSNPSNPCSTSDTTPTLYFNTSEAAFCAIGVSNFNYTQMSNSRNCTSGEGTVEHACDLILQDELVYEDSIVYLSCKDSSGNMNTTSTSGPLSLTITGLEAAGDTALGKGVQGALLSGYTNYTTQQIYARNLSNNQTKGTFDWVAKKGSKVWALNYITKGEQHVSMFNLTPVLYVLEINNVTNANISIIVEKMINSTK